ncbi:MAG: hypothetical protein HC830_05125 [Bacteroidetes bacterium]|nr:hypothetical protein [Bacteroidota bacterium]
MVSINALDVADTVIFPKLIPVSVRAEAPNRCWSQLKVSFTDKDQFSYIVKAYGTYRSSGLYPDNIVTHDTIIFFNPPASVKYKFFVYYDYQTIRTDSVVVR